MLLWHSLCWRILSRLLCCCNYDDPFYSRDAAGYCGPGYCDASYCDAGYCDVAGYCDAAGYCGQLVVAVQHHHWNFGCFYDVNLFTYSDCYDIYACFSYPLDNYWKKFQKYKKKKMDCKQVYKKKK
eukprot:178544_1